MLLKKDTAFLWLNEHQAAFDQLKANMLSTMSLNHFNPTWDTRLATDASRLHGLGFVLMQHQGNKNAVIQCKSRSLSSAEKNCSTLELELTAIVWAIKKCNFFLKGIEKFKVVTDHRPLVGIFHKTMPQIENTRITRLREKILDHPFEVKWMAGKDNVIADALSHAPTSPTEGSTAVPINSCIVATRMELATIIDQSKTDPAYKQIVDDFRHGRNLSDLPVDHPARHLKQVWHQISLTTDGIILVDGDKIYLPPGARANTLQCLHEGHCGYGKTIQTARSLYYWPSMKQDIRNMIDNCEACQQLRPSKPLEPFITTSANFPMEQISIDLMHVGSKTYMVTADRYSGYIWVEMLCDHGTKAVTDVLDKITRIFGIPVVCRTDSGPQFHGPFNEYCKRKGIEHENLFPLQSTIKQPCQGSCKDRQILVTQNKAVRILFSFGSLEKYIKRK